MKIEIKGTCNQKLFLVKFIKDVTNMSLYDAKSLAEETIYENKPLIMDVSDFEQAKIIFDEIFNTSSLTIRKHRSEIIKKFLNDNK